MGHVTEVKELLKKERHYKLWACQECGHEVMAIEKPAPIKWTDHHVCYFTQMGDKK